MFLIDNLGTLTRPKIAHLEGGINLGLVSENVNNLTLLRVSNNTVLSQ